MKGRRKLTPEEILEYLYVNNPAGVPEIAKYYGVNRATVQYWIDKLITHGLVAPVYGKTYGEKYKLMFKLRRRIDYILILAPPLLLTYMLIFQGVNPLLSKIILYILALSSIPLSIALYINLVRLRIYKILKKIHI